MRLKKYIKNEVYQVKMKKPKKYKKINPKTNREKTFRKQRFIDTHISPEERSFKNIPKYSDGSLKVNFIDWLEIERKKLEDGSIPNWGWDKADRCWGWSHRAIYGFKVGDEIKDDNLGKKKPSDPDFIIKDRKHAEEVAKTFADNVS